MQLTTWLKPFKPSPFWRGLTGQLRFKLGLMPATVGFVQAEKGNEVGFRNWALPKNSVKAQVTGVMEPRAVASGIKTRPDVQYHFGLA
jgi:hypothetical protein